MIKKIILFIFILYPINSLALIKVDITRGNLDPLPLAVSPLAIDNESKNRFQKILNKKNIGSEISLSETGIDWSNSFNMNVFSDTSGNIRLIMSE